MPPGDLFRVCGEQRFLLNGKKPFNVFQKKNKNKINPCTHLVVFSTVNFDCSLQENNKRKCSALIGQIR